MARQVLPILGGIVGGFFGVPQLGFALGSVVAAVVDPGTTQGPKLGELAVQRSNEGMPRAIIFGTATCTGYILDFGPPIKTTEVVSGEKGAPKSEQEVVYRNYAIAICEGQIGGVLRVWENDKLVYDVRAGSLMLAESVKWKENKVFYAGTEDQLPDVFLELNVSGIGETPAYRGTAYMVVGLEDLTNSVGAIPQYRFEVARELVNDSIGSLIVGPPASSGYFTTLAVNDSGQPMQIMNQSGASPPFGVDYPGSYDVVTYDKDDFTTIEDTLAITNAGDSTGDTRLWPIAIDETGAYAIGFDANFGYCKLLFHGSHQATLAPNSGASPGWWYNEGGYYPEYGGLVWFYENFIYIGVRTTGSSGTNWDSIFKFPKTASGTQYAVATISGVTGTTPPIFWMNVSREGKVRSIAANGGGDMKTYDGDLTLLGTSSVPAAIAGYVSGSTGPFWGFGIDEAKGFNVFIIGSSPTCNVYDNSGNLIASKVLTGATANAAMTRVMFTDEAIWVQRREKTYRIDTPATFSGVPMMLGDIVADLHDRCGIPVEDYDVSELTDEVMGMTITGDYTAADAINTLRSCYFFDKAEPGDKLYYPKRGKAVVTTLTFDDLIDVPDLSKRDQVAEVPKKVHLLFQNPTAGYSPVKATYERSSVDVTSIVETTIEVPVVLSMDEGQQMVHKQHKVLTADAQGEIKLTIPDSLIKLIPSDCIGLSLRGQVRRLRIDECEWTDGALSLTLRTDRQSAYTSNLTGIPIPEPMLPPSTIVGDTTFVFADVSSRIESEDDLHYLVAGVGSLPGWYGWMLQRSFDAGANYSNVEQFNVADIIGSLVDDVPAASEHYTDTTNTVRVQLFRDGQTLEDLSVAQFLSEGGAFILEKADGSYEVMQYLDADDEGDGIFALTTLHRGRLNSGASAHTAGARFAVLSSAHHIPAQSAWIGQALTHRPVSLGDSPENASPQTDTYVGRSQLEWPVASLVLARDVSDNVSGTWAPRHRFGTDDAPVASINFQGYRVTLDDGVLPAVTFDTTVANFTYDASALGSPLTVSVSALNRITGAGPATSGSV